MGLIFEIMHRFLEKAEIIIIIFSQNGINGRLIQAQEGGEDDEVMKNSEKIV